MEIGPIIRKEFVSVDEEETVSQLLGKLKQQKEQAVLVFKGKRYAGVLERWSLLRSKMDASSVKVKNFTKRTPLLTEYEDAISTAYTFYQSNVDYLPVARRGEVLGVLHALDLVTFATLLPEAKVFRVHDVRLVKFTKVTNEDPMATVLDVMQKQALDHVPVYAQGKIFGIVSFQDILRKYLQWVPTKSTSARLQKELGGSRGAQVDRFRWAGLPVSSFSTMENLVTVDSKHFLHEAAKQMEEKGIHSLIVQENGDVLGLLTVKNMLRTIGSLKIPPTYNISFIGLNSPGIGSYEKYVLKKVSSIEAFKLQRMIRNEFSIVLHLKSYEKRGKAEKRRKYSVHLRVEYPGQQITVSEDDWEVVAALHRAWNNVKSRVKKKFRGDRSWPKSYE